jgi:hypothetical protein
VAAAVYLFATITDPPEEHGRDRRGRAASLLVLANGTFSYLRALENMVKDRPGWPTQRAALMGAGRSLFAGGVALVLATAVESSVTLLAEQAALFASPTSPRARGVQLAAGAAAACLFGYGVALGMVGLKGLTDNLFAREPEW